MKKTKLATTLAEILIAITILSVLIVGIMNLFTSSIKNSANTMTHQDNMEAANILMAQIEHDLVKATNIIVPAANEESSEATWENNSLKNASNIYTKFTYNNVNQSEGINRCVTINDNKSENYNYAKEHPTKITFKHITTDSKSSSESGVIIRKHAMLVNLVVGSKNSEVPPFTMKRLIFIPGSY